MPTNDFLPFATTDLGTNLLTQANWIADAQRAIGNQPGVARSQLVNKAMRQSSLIAAVLSQYISDLTGENAVDDGTTATLLTNLKNAVKLSAAALLGGAYKLPCRAITSANIVDLAAGAPNVVDGVALDIGDRVLVNGQTTTTQNGIYSVVTVGSGVNGAWVRAADTSGAGHLVAGSLVVVTGGTAYADSIWTLTTDGVITIGSSALAFARRDSTPIGVGQTWQDLLLSRAVGTNYTNTTGRPIMVSVSGGSNGTLAHDLIVDGIIVQRAATNPNATSAWMSGIVPAGSVYSVSNTFTLGQWAELR